MRVVTKMTFEAGPEKIVSVSTVRMFDDGRPWVVVVNGKRFVGTAFSCGDCEGFSPSPKSARLRTTSRLVLEGAIQLGYVA